MYQTINNTDEIKSLFDQGGMTYHFYMHSLLIVSPVRSVETLGSESLKIKFDGGNVTVYEAEQIHKVRRPSNIVVECEYCYQLLNEYRDPIGYIYKVK